MNRGQALIPLGFGRFQYKDDQSPKRSALVLELMRAHGWQELRIARPPNIGEVTTHVCQGPPAGEDFAVGPPLPHRRPLIERVLDALRAASRSNEKLQERDLCERLHASRASKRVEKSLRVLRNRGLVGAEGNKRCTVYFALTGVSS